jgi:chromate transporter
MSAVAAGLIVATAIKMARAVPRRILQLCLVGLAFAGVGLLRFPLIGVISVLGPAGVLLAWRSRES